MHIAQLIDESCVYLESEKASSPLTITSYRSDIRDFAAYLESQSIEPDPALVSPPLLRQYLVRLTRRGLKPTTRARRLHALRSFWRFLA